MVWIAFGTIRGAGAPPGEDFPNNGRETSRDAIGHAFCKKECTNQNNHKMKTSHVICLGLAITAGASAQVPAAPPVVVEEAPPVVIERTVTETVTEPEVEALRRLDAALARKRLGIAPVELPAVEPGVVERTTTTVETPGLPPRVYQTERNVVVVEGRELPYLTIPVLFVEGTAELLDEESRLAIQVTAAAIKDVLAANPTAVFDVEGHTSTDGSYEMNMKLSADRARRVHTELIERYGVPASALSAHGYGENFPNYPDGTEAELMLDRRVLVVRVK
jgi:outer membrane protein OmpA-like peptidoglycan-associated protein